LVTSSPSWTPFPSRTAFVATVVPCAKRAIWPLATCSAAMKRSTAAITACDGSCGVDGTLVT
jgi:hypothetical protein